MARGAWLMIAAAGMAAGGALFAQGRGSVEWTTARFDAQRSAWLRSDARLTKDAVLRHELRFLWKARFDNEQRQLNSLTEPIILDRLIGFRGFKALAFIGGSADRVFAIDTDLAKPYWTTHLNYSANTGGPPPSSTTCPGGLMATPTRRTPLEPAPAGAAGGRGRGGRSGSAVGDPGRGAAVLSEAPQGRGAQGRGAIAPAGPVAPPAKPASPAVAPVPFGGVDPIYAVGSDGLLHTLRSSNGSDAEPPTPFLPPSARASSLVFVDGVVYAATSGECGAAPNAVWALDLADKDRKVSTWKTGGGPVAGQGGVAFGADGTLYAAVGADGSRRAALRPGGLANAVVALDRHSLERKDWFTAEKADFNSSPMAFHYKERDLVAVTGGDGRLYLLDGSSLGGADHQTPLHVTAVFSAPGAGGALATWEDQGTRWILAPMLAAASAPPAAGRGGAAVAASGRVAAFKLVDRNGALSLEQGWTSRPLVSPLAPMVVNGIAFVASSGEYRSAAGASLTAPERARRSTPAVLYALDATTGKELWNSGATITSFARAGLSAGAGQVYVVTYDNTLYAFGIPMEH
ncbi:MAG: PQQ-binding-like beta-propeller repeat protein [Acidobacteriota bacterium]